MTLTPKEWMALDRLTRELELAVHRDDRNCLPHYKMCVEVLRRNIGTDPPVVAPAIEPGMCTMCGNRPAETSYHWCLRCCNEWD